MSADCARLPELVVLISGKRKSGKDYIAKVLNDRLLKICSSKVFHISEPLKKQYAIEHSLDFERLLDSSAYKENYRMDMIAWGEERRNNNPDYFCDLVAKLADKNSLNIWIIADIRRETDLEYFQRHFRVLKMKVYAQNEERQRRGWTFVTGIDDASSECALDNFNSWDIVVDNSLDKMPFEQIDKCIKLVTHNLSQQKHVECGVVQQS